MEEENVAAPVDAPTEEEKMEIEDTTPTDAPGDLSTDDYAASDDEGAAAEAADEEEKVEEPTAEEPAAEPEAAEPAEEEKPEEEKPAEEEAAAEEEEKKEEPEEEKVEEAEEAAEETPAPVPVAKKSTLTQKQLVKEHGISWKEANDHVMASQAELGEDASEEEIAALANEKAAAAKGSKPVEAEESKEEEKEEEEEEEDVPMEKKKTFRGLLYDLGHVDDEIVVPALYKLEALGLDKTHKENPRKTKLLVARGAAALAVLQALKNHGEANIEVAAVGLGLLLNLTTLREKGCIDAIVELNGSGIVIPVMTAHQDDVDIQLHGLGLLCNLSMVRGEIVKISQNGGVDVIITDMEQWPKVDFVQRRACKTLGNMADQNQKLPSVQTEIKNKKGLSTVGKCLETFPKDSPSFREAKRTMNQFF
mmetsp:Transcript_22142/g.47965  ORF Transcript_22142/g.47965 Transcript_22142/m.47965 type:complete len:421 (+) Transcript_22142:344-1606(+)